MIFVYVVTVCMKGQLNNVAHYEEYEHFLSDLIDCDSRLYSKIPKDALIKTDFECPRICMFSTDELGFGTDYEYRYKTGITVCCGTILTAEDMARSVRRKD